MSHPKNICGEKFGHLTAIAITGKQRREMVWECICVCGNRVDVRLSNLRTGNTRSCGCGGMTSGKGTIGSGTRDGGTSEDSGSK